MTEYEYHIYVKDRCLYHCLPENEFKEKWEMLHHMVGLMKTDYVEGDLSYSQVSVEPMGAGAGKYHPEPSGGDSYRQILNKLIELNYR